MLSICNAIEYISYGPELPKKNVICTIHNFDHPEEIKNLASGSRNATVLYSRATITVAGKEWYNCYISSLVLMKK